MLLTRILCVSTQNEKTELFLLAICDETLAKDNIFKLQTVVSEPKLFQLF